MALSGLGRVPGVGGGAGSAGISARVPSTRQQYASGRTPFPSPRTSLEVFTQRSTPIQDQPRLVITPAQALSASELDELSIAEHLLAPFLLYQRDLTQNEGAILPQLAQVPIQQHFSRPPEPLHQAVLPHAHSAPAGQLPEQLSRLLDPSQPVALPLANLASPMALDNWKLDKLVSALGRNRATWRRCLHLYEWLKDAGHHLDDRLCTTLIRVCADHGDSLAALGIYEWMRTPRSAGGAGLAPTTYTYTAAMRASLSAGLLERAMAVWDDAMCAPGGMVPDCRLCITYIETCTRLRQTDKALAMYAEMRDAPAGSAMAPSVHAYTAAMRAATEGGRWYRALDIWQDMKNAGCAASGHAYAAVISACACGSDWVRAVALFEDMTAAGINPDVVSCTSLITALAAAGEADRAEQVVRWMLTVGLKPNVRTYTALLTALGNAKQWSRAVDLLWSMQHPQSGSIQPNAYTYSALLKSLGEHGQWQLAEAVFSHLEGQLLTEAQRSGASASPPDAHLAVELRRVLDQATSAAASRNKVNTWLQQQALNGRADVATTATSLLQQQLLQKQNWTSPAHLNGLSLDLPASAMTAVLHDGAAAAAAPQLAGFSLFSSAYDHVGFHEEMMAESHQQQQHLQSPRRSETGSSASTSSTILTPSSPILQTLTQISASLGDQLSHMSVSEAVSSSLYDSSSAGSSTVPHQGAGGAGGSSQRSGGRGVARATTARPENRIVNEVVCGALMLAYERAGKWQEAVTVLLRALALGIMPNTVMFNTAISAAGKAGELDLAEQLFALVRLPDAVTYETLIAAYGMAGCSQKAELVLRSMQQCGVRPRDFAYCGLVAAYSLAGDCEGALQVRQMVRRDGNPMTTHIYNALIAACERAGQYVSAIELVQMMRRDGVEPNAMTQQLMVTVARQGAQAVERQQHLSAAAAMGAALVAAGSMQAMQHAGAF